MFTHYTPEILLNPVFEDLRKPKAPNNGSFEFIHNIKDIMENLVYVVVKTSKGEFVPDREDDELTLALSKSEHSGCTRGYGSMPWKFSFCKWHSQQ
jgi:hypothetical protein